MKRMVCFFLCVIICFSFVMPFSAKTQIKIGDANNDGYVNMKDILEIRKYMAHIIETLDKGTNFTDETKIIKTNSPHVAYEMIIIDEDDSSYWFYLKIYNMSPYVRLIMETYGVLDENDVLLFSKRSDDAIILLPYQYGLSKVLTVKKDVLDNNELFIQSGCVDILYNPAPNIKIDILRHSDDNENTIYFESEFVKGFDDFGNQDSYDKYDLYKCNNYKVTFFDENNNILSNIFVERNTENNDGFIECDRAMISNNYNVMLCNWNDDDIININP